MGGARVKQGQSKGRVIIKIETSKVRAKENIFKESNGIARIIQGSSED